MKQEQTHVSKQRRQLLLQGASGALALAGAPFLQAQGLNKMMISYPTRSGATWPMWIAEKAGLYKKYGLDVTLQFGVHPAGIAVLLSGQAQMTNYGLEQILTASVRDPALVIMGSSLNRGNFGLMAHSSIKTVAQIKDKRVGVGRVGDPLYIYTLDLLEKYNMGPRDVQWIPTGTDSATRTRMLETGQLDAALMVAPAYFKLQAEGFNLLDSLANHPDIYVSTAYTFKKTWAVDNTDTVVRLIKAHAEAIKRFYDDKAFAMQAYSDNDPAWDAATVGKLYDTYVERNVLDRVPLLQKSAVDSVVRRMADDVPALKSFDAAQVINMGPVRKLISEGYFRNLFGASIAAEENAKLKNAYS
jgi:ABC-type nitrate/sulfonate/bicarbonate transport system substrate-binding protein